MGESKKDIVRFDRGGRGRGGEVERGGVIVRRVHFLKSPLDEEKQSMAFYSNFT